jgi:hypothetical protein
MATDTIRPSPDSARTADPRPHVPAWARWLAVVAGVAGLLVVGPALFIGSILYTGCFFECSDPDRIGGTVLLMSAAGLVALAVGAFGLAATGRWATARTAAIVTALPASVLAVAALWFGR